jgi:hypothetical protein
MSALSNRLRNAPKVVRILLLPAIVLLVLLLVVLVVLQYAVPGTGAAQTSLQTATAIPTAGESAEPAETPIPTQTPVLQKTPTPRATQTPTPAIAAEVAEPEGTIQVFPSPEMQILEEPAEPAPISAAPTAAESPPILRTSGQIGNVLRNGDFEQGFQPNGVGLGWGNFNNSSGLFSFHTDDWPSVTGEGEHTQFMRIRSAELPDRYLGIYQTANVLPGQTYTLSIRGLVRTNAGNVQHTDYGYRLEVGVDPLGGQNWKMVQDWIELPWDEQLRLEEEFRVDESSTVVTARSDRLTVFVRAWKKWVDAGEGAYDVDDIRLVGPTHTVAAAGGVVAGSELVAASEMVAVPVTGEAPATPWSNLRTWVTVALLSLLLGGAARRLVWKQT